MSSESLLTIDSSLNCVTEQHQLAQQKALLRLVTRIRESLNLEVIFRTTAQEVRQLLTADRVGVFRFFPDSGWNDGEFVSESVADGYVSALAIKVQDHCFGEQYAIHYQEGRVQAIADIYAEGLKDCHVQILGQFAVRANLVVPVLQGRHLWGLLCIHQCSAPRQWQEDEIEFVQAVAEHLAIAIQQADLLTVRQQQDEALIKSEARFRTIATTMSGAIFQFCNRNGVWTVDYMSDRFYDITGTTAAAIMADMTVFVAQQHPEDYDRYIASIVEAVENLTPWQYEGRLIRPDGTVRWWGGESIPTRTEQGEIIFCGAMFDITGRVMAEQERQRAEAERDRLLVAQVGAEMERKAAEAALVESEARFRSLVENVASMIFEMTPDGVFTYASPVFKTVMGYSRSEIEGKSFVPLILPDDLPICSAALQMVIEQGKPIAGLEYRVICKDGAIQWHSANLTPLRDADQQIIALLGVSTDVSDRKVAEITLQQKAQELATALQELQRTQAQLVQHEKMSSLGQLVAGIAHEINNPVNFIHGNVSHVNTYTQGLLDLIALYQTAYPQPTQAIAAKVEDIDLDFLKEDLPKLLTSMKVGTERIREIVRSLRVFSRLDEAEVKAVDLHEGIDSTLMILQNRLKVKSDRPAIQVIKNYSSLPLIECFAGQLNQVFMNILTNAIDALEEHDCQRSLEAINQEPGTIAITTECGAENHLIIRIADNGPGMSESVRQRLFDPFFTTKPVGKGTGMGLSISYQIITERHQGRLYCHSTPGQGTEFVIELPVR